MFIQSQKTTPTHNPFCLTSPRPTFKELEKQKGFDDNETSCFWVFVNASTLRDTWNIKAALANRLLIANAHRTSK